MNNPLRTLSHPAQAIRASGGLARVLPLLLFAWVTVSSSSAQDVVLPDLAPREVEITGDLTISFPSLRRQPLIGFNPPPRVPEIPVSRIPFSEAYKQPSADLPPSPLQPPSPPAVSSLASRMPARGYVTATAGRYLDRTVEGVLTLSLTERSSTTLDINYFGTNGQDVGPGNASSARDLFNGDLTWNRMAPGGWFTAQAGLTRNAWSLFGATPDAFSGASPNPDRTLTSWFTGLAHETRAGSRIGSHTRLEVERTLVETDIFNPDVRVDPSTARQTQRLSLDSYLEIPAGPVGVRFDVAGGMHGFDTGNALDVSTLKYGEAALVFLTPRDRILTLDIGGSVMGYDSEAQTASGSERYLAWFAPVLRARYWLGGGLFVTGGTRPGLEATSLKAAYDVHPFLMDEPLVLPRMNSVDAYLGVELTSVSFNGVLSAGWTDSPSASYARVPTTSLKGYTSGYFAYDHARTRTTWVEGDLTYIASTALEAGVRLRVQDAQLEETEQALPFVSPVSSRIWVTSSFLDARLQLLSAIRFESARPVQPGGDNDGDSLLDAELNGQWWIRPELGITVGIRHLLSEPTFWPGYPLESTAVRAGLRWRW
ncbi:MAG: hypothetical protein RIE53_03230 [Rhodothermales bacterium]